MLARSFLALLFACLAVMLVMPGVTFAAKPDDVTPLLDSSTVKPYLPLKFKGAAGVASDASGNLYIADTANNQIVMLTPATDGVFTQTVIDDAAVKYNAPVGIATDLSGNVYVADTGNNRVIMIVADTTTKLISSASQKVTVAGNGIAGFSGDGAPALSASLNGPTGVAVDASGNIYIADNGNYRIRKVPVTIKVTPATPAKLATPTTPAIPATPELTTYTPGAISTIAGDGTATKLTAYGIALSPAGDLYIADAGNNRILKMTGMQGPPSVFAGNGIEGFSGDGGLASLAQLNKPSGVVTNGDYLYIADTMNSRVRRVSHATNVISTRLGPNDMFSAITAPVGFANPDSVAVDAAGTLYVGDTVNHVIQQVFGSVSAITTAKTPGGSYPTTQYVELISSKAATKYYTTDGSPPIIDSVPTSASLPYTVPIPISATTTLRFTSIDSVGNPEVTNIATYTINPAAPIVSVSQVGGTFAIPLTVTLASTNKPNVTVTIYYSIDGKSPTTASKIYSVPLAITKTTTLMFFGVDAAGNRGAVEAQTYIIDTVPPVTTASVPSGFYASTQSVTLTTDEKADTYYTIDDWLTTKFFKYDDPKTLSIEATTTLKYYSKDYPAGNREQIKTQIYTIAAITASPLGGTYNIKKTVTLSSSQSVNAIYYTIDGKSPTTTSSKYSTPLEITKTTTLMYFAVDAIGNKSAVGSQTYIIDTVAPVTTASVPSGTYSSAQSVNLTTDDPEATIYWTIDNSTPTETSTNSKHIAIITIPINATTTLKYFSKDTAGNPEQIKTQVYIIDAIPPTVSATPDGSFNVKQTVTLTPNKQNVTIYYTITGIAPTTTSSKYSSPLPIAKTTTLMYFGVDAAGSKSAVVTKTYIIDTVTPITKASLAEGSYSSDQVVILTTDDPDPETKTYYTTDGRTPAVSLDDLYKGKPITIATVDSTTVTKTTLKYFSRDKAGNQEDTKTQVYTIDPIPPKLSVSPVGAATPTIPKTVTLTSDKLNVTIYYTTTGIAPTDKSTKYSAPLPITKTTTLMYFGVDAAGNKSAVGSQTYTIDSVTPITTASLPSGTYSSIQSVTLTTDDPTATIYYTIDGSTPTASSAKYTAPIIISAPTVLKYFAKDTTGNLESVKNQVYTIITLTTSASPKGGQFLTPQTVVLSTNNPGATIYYTTDGTVPSADTKVSKNTQKYSKPLLLQAYKTTLKFFSVDVLGVVENIKTEVYLINSLTTTVTPKGGVFGSPQAVTLKSSNAGATIYYTLDGTTPSKDAKLSTTTQTYTAPINVQAGKTVLKYFSLDSQGISENINTEIYTVDSAAPITTAKCGETANSIELSAKDSNDLLPEILYSTSNSANVTGTPFIFYRAPITFTNNTIVKFFAVDSAGNVEQMKTVSCPTVVAPLDVKPAMYLETLTDGAMTSNGSLYVSGNVDPTATLAINGTAVALTTDGGFSYKEQLVIGSNSIKTVATIGAQSSSDTRNINYYLMSGPQADDPHIAIGTNSGVAGNRIRVPLTLTSGYQAATVSMDLDTTNFGGALADPTVEIAQTAAALGKFVKVVPAEGVYKIVITDINQPADGVTKRPPIPDGVIADLTFSIASPGSVSKPLVVNKYSANDPDNNVMAVNAQTNGVANIVSKPGNGWDTVANAEVAATLKDVLNSLYMLLDPVTYPVSGSADLNGDGRVQIDELQRVINSFIGL